MKDIQKKYNELDHYALMDFLRENLGRPFSNSADWGGAYVWPLGGSNYVGEFLYYGDNELLVLKRELNEETYIDTVLYTF